MAWETIIEEWNRSVTVEAIREAVQLASQALISSNGACAQAVQSHAASTIDITRARQMP